MARGRLKITALTIKVPALWPLTALRRQRLTLRATVPTARAARAWARARPPGINVKGQSLLPGTQAKFLSYLQPGPQWGIVLGLKGHRAGPEWTQTGSAWQSKHRRPWPVPPGSAACVSLLGERFFLQRSVGVPAPQVWLTPFRAPVPSPGPWWSVCTVLWGWQRESPLPRTRMYSRQDAQRAVGGPAVRLPWGCTPWGVRSRRGDRPATVISE